MTASLYSLRSTPQPGEFTILKFSPDYDVESVYALSEKTCTCPQGHKPKCKHRAMLHLFLTQAHVDDGWFLDWSTRLWRHPVGDLQAGGRAANAPLLADTTIMGNAGQEETIAKRVAGGFASDGANAVLAREARSNPPPQAASSSEPQAIQRSLATPAPDPKPAPAPGELRRRRF